MSKCKSIQAYRMKKLQMIERDFYINLTNEEINRINQIDDMSLLDRVCRKIIFAHL